MERLNYYLDTYAIIEIIKGSGSYAKFLTGNFFTSVFNLYELYYLLLRDFNKEIAKKQFLRFKQNIIKISDDTIFNASEFRLRNERKHYSYTDALGYSLSIENNFLFLTGDDAFKSLKNVEFVK